ncbi:MAG: hypothetical protein ACTSVW_00235 [Candidatus Njordarchaeales archaeon]
MSGGRIHTYKYIGRIQTTYPEAFLNQFEIYLNTKQVLQKLGDQRVSIRGEPLSGIPLKIIGVLLGEIGFIEISNVSRNTFPQVSTPSLIPKKPEVKVPKAEPSIKSGQQPREVEEIIYLIEVYFKSTLPPEFLSSVQIYLRGYRTHRSLL